MIMDRWCEGTCWLITRSSTGKNRWRYIQTQPGGLDPHLHMRRGLVGRSVGWGGCAGQQMHSRIPVTTARADGLCLWGANGRLHGNRWRRWRPYRPNSRTATVRNICRYFSTTKHQHTHSNNKRHPASYYYLFLFRPTFYSFLFLFTFRRFFSRNITSIFPLLLLVWVWFFFLPSIIVSSRTNWCYGAMMAQSTTARG